ncbi:Na+/H+ antiporter subunit E [Halococcus sp. IIIV-5B]|uniref:Na+/H+ antiporter subunit E n=1 Tax=Halococcus sp. IIIV-5B TaxID=2321230 RepID=UPI000E73AC25|nr:Na+/H+ antiporter subunit E [Halococcus sp. IIIV-5B]RJT06527.1 cation transporter [Halococcus sp. IIIV-5B]
MKRWPVIGVTLAVLWLFVRGVELGVDYVLGEFVIGLLIGLPIAFVFRRFYAEEFAFASTVRVLPAAIAYLTLFAKELIVANLDVVYRVLSPSMPIDPDVVAIPLRVETDAAVTTIANSITLTPGTLTMDYDEESNTLYVHGITGKNRSGVVEPVRRWEDYALVIFDEDASPDDTPPRPRGGSRGD